MAQDEGSAARSGALLRHGGPDTQHRSGQQALRPADRPLYTRPRPTGQTQEGGPPPRGGGGQIDTGQNHVRHS